MAYDNQTNINSNGMTFFDTNGMLMKVGFLNESLSIGLWTAVEEGGKKTYPKEKRQNLVLTKERVAALYDIIIHKVLPAYKEGISYNGGVFTSMKKDMVFEIRVENGNVFALYHTDIDADRKPKNTTVFTFVKTPAIEKYNTDSGEFELPMIDADFYLFTKGLEAYLNNVPNGACAHTAKYHNHFRDDNQYSYLTSIANKLGVTPPSNGYNNYHANGNSDAWNNANNNAQSYAPPATEINGLDGIV